MKKAEIAKEWHEKNEVVCENCKHFRTREDALWKEFTWCDLNRIGRGRWRDEYCNLWEGKDDTETGL